MKAMCYKEDKTVKNFYDVKNITYDHKYNYWILTQRIYHHDIITIHKSLEFDKVILIDKDGNKREVNRDE